LDVSLPEVLATSEVDIKSIPGVVDSGLFIGYVSEVVVASASKGVYSI
jgi:ribose 5-phosphate isomerase